MGKTKLKF